ncbi:MAG: hypothetical protein ACHQD9_00190, partial [Chitinophagales bacterium]
EDYWRVICRQSYHAVRLFGQRPLLGVQPPLEERECLNLLGSEKRLSHDKCYAKAEHQLILPEHLSEVSPHFFCFSYNFSLGGVDTAGREVNQPIDAVIDLSISYE